jgi:nicotianamine synthase
MTFGCEDVMVEGSGSEKEAWEKFDVVFLAALVGNDTHSKLSILGSLARKLKKGALVVARSARGVRGVLYPVCSFHLIILFIDFPRKVEVRSRVRNTNSV